MGEDGVEVWQGGAPSWECDAMGHLNVGFYVVKCMEGLAGLARALGMPDAFTPEALATLAVRDQHIRFLREARPNAALAMTAGVLEIGEADMRVVFLMRHPDGELAATFNSVVAHVTAAERRPFPWPERVRARAEALRIALPRQAAPRSMDLEPVLPQASRERAEALGLQRIAMGVVRPADADVFGRMRAEAVMFRISEGAPHLVRRIIQPILAADGRRTGGAVLEYRLIYLQAPGVGRGFEIRSGLSDSDARLRRLTHWMLDRDTGRPWAVAQAVTVALDLDTRRIIDLGEEAQAQLRAALKPELSF